MKKILFSMLFLVACVLAEDFNRPSVYEPETQYHIYTKIVPMYHKFVYSIKKLLKGKK